MKIDTEQNSFKEALKFISAWPIAAYLSLLVFVSTLAFEYGFFTYWKLPYELISFLPENAFRVFFLLFSGGVLLLYSVAVSIEWKWYRWLMIMLFLFFTLLLIIQVSRTIGGLAPSVLLFVLAYLFWSTSELYKYINNVSKEKRLVVPFLRPVGLFLSSMLLAFPLLSGVIGYFYAAEQENFIVLNTEQRLVVLRPQGKIWIAGKLIEQKQNNMIDGIKLINPGSLHDVLIEQIQINGLQRADSMKKAINENQG